MAGRPVTPAVRSGWLWLSTLSLVTAAAFGACSEGPSLPSVGSPPILDAVEPDTALASEPIRLQLRGQGFEAEQVAYWDRWEFTVQHSDVWGFYVDIPAWAIRTAGPYPLSIGGPDSNDPVSEPVDVIVIDRNPQILGLSPPSATAGQEGLRLTVTGRFFGEGSTVSWNGTPRTTERVSSGSLSLELTAADLADAGSGRITVDRGITAEGVAAESEAVGFPIIPTSPSTSSTEVLSLEASALAADSVRDVVYGVVPTSAADYAGEFLAIDPFAAEVLWSVPVGDATAPVVTDDGSFAYLSVPDDMVVRIDLAARVPDLMIPVPAGTGPALDIVPIPGFPRQIAVALERTSFDPRVPTIVMYDGDRMLSYAVGGFEDMDQIEPSSRATRIYAYGSSELKTLRLLSSGITVIERATTRFYGGLGPEMVHANGMLLGANGLVVDAEYAVPVGRFSVEGAFRPDVPNGRVHFLVEDELKVMHLLAFEELGSLSVPEATGSTSIVRFGDDGLAFGGGDRVVFVRSGLIGN